MTSSTLRTFWRLGLGNLLRNLVYQIQCRTGFFRIVNGLPEFTILENSRAPFFDTESYGSACTNDSGSLKQELTYFGVNFFKLEHEVPDWFFDPFTRKKFERADLPWWKWVGGKGIDIKCIWELSRFDWIVELASSARKSAPNRTAAVQRMNSWTADWVQENPPYLGPNWQCAQESSIRILNMITAYLLISDLKKCSENFLALVALHLKRISVSTNYAESQSNNHIVSEAAALFVGGTLLKLNGKKNGANWQRQGRKLLERSVRNLFAVTGGFAQYSLNYHRLALQLLNVCEVIRRRCNEPPFLAEFYARAKAASEWLFEFVDPSSGRVPNLGANDGAHILRLASVPYHDFRPEVQLACALFCQFRAFEFDGGVLELTKSLVSIEDLKGSRSRHSTFVCHETGFLRRYVSGGQVYFRFPRFKFRPSQCDLHHLDLWIAGEPVLIDGGTYSYHASNDKIAAFAGAKGHNVVQFGANEQMPKLRKFLFGDWPNSRFQIVDVSAEKFFAESSFTDYLGNAQTRKLESNDGQLVITDRFKTNEKSVILRWRLAPGRRWQLDSEFSASSLNLKVLFSSESIKFKLMIVEGTTSESYLSEQKIQVLEIHLTGSGALTSIFSW